MTFTYTYIIALPLATAALTLIIALFVWRRRYVSAVGPFMVLCLAIGEWSVCYALELASADMATVTFWVRMEYLGIVVAPVAWLITALRYTGRDQWLTPRLLAALGIVPAITLLLVWTSSAHSAIWRTINVNFGTPFTVFSSEHGIWFWVHTAYSYLAILGGTVALVRTYTRVPVLYRRQASILLVSALLPWLGNMLYLTGMSPVPNLDLTPIFFMLSGLAIAWGLLRLQLLDIGPVARDTVFESMTNGVLVLDQRGQVVDINRAALQVIGSDQGTIVGLPASQVLDRWPHLVARYHHVEEIHDEFSTTNDQGERYFNLQITPLRDHLGRMVGRLVMWHDITERRQAEAAIRHQKELLEQQAVELQHAKEEAEAASRAKSAFLAMISHELRTPLSVIMGYSDLVLMEHMATGVISQKNDIEHIRSAADHLLGLITSILDFTKVEAGKMQLFLEQCDVPILMREIASMAQPLMQQNRNTFYLDCPAYLGVVEADVTRVRQVILNLLSNAAKFTTEGQVTLRVRRIGSQNGPDTIAFEVTDTGIGMSSDQLKIIFQEFTQAAASTTRTYGGTGLGLALCRRLCHMMGGAITVTSSLGHGSIFTATIPATSVDRTPAITNATNTNADLHQVA